MWQQATSGSQKVAQHCLFPSLPLSLSLLFAFIVSYLLPFPACTKLFNIVENCLRLLLACKCKKKEKQKYKPMHFQHVFPLHTICIFELPSLITSPFFVGEKLPTVKGNNFQLTPDLIAIVIRVVVIV